MLNNKEFELFLQQRIPSIKSLGFEVLDFSDSKIVIFAPLDLNINYKNTAFGGSINTLLTTCCWSMVYRMIKPLDLNAQIVIQSSSIQYIRPVSSDLEGNCYAPEETVRNMFKETYLRYGKARIALKASIINKGEALVQFFVAISNSQLR